MTSYSRPIFDVDFSGLSDASSWPSEYFKLLNATAGASATVNGGWGLLDLGTATGYTSNVLLKLWAYPIEGDKFELLTRLKIINTGQTIWIQFYYRRTNEDVTGDTGYSIDFWEANYNFNRNTAFSNLQGPVTTWSLAANTIVWARMRVIGDKHMARAWVEGTTEPQTWPMIWMNKDNPRVGKWYINSGSSDGTHRQIAVSRISIREIGDPYEPILSNRATATFNGTGAQTAFVIPHMLDATPTNAEVTPGTSAAAGNRYVTFDATNITVTYTTAPATGTGNVVLNWRAEV